MSLTRPAIGFLSGVASRITCRSLFSFAVLSIALAGCATQSADPPQTKRDVVAAMSGPLRPTLAQMEISPADRAAIRAAAGTGDGQTVSTAIRTDRINHGYLFLRELGFRFQRHTVTEGGLDVFDTIKRSTGNPQKLLFAVTPSSPEAQAELQGVRRVMTSGDGKTRESAIAVNSVPQEYAILFLMGLQRAKQQLVGVPGQRYDVLTVIDPVDQSQSELWFKLLFPS